MRPVETRPEGPRAGWGSWEGQQALSPSARGLGEHYKVPQRRPGQSPGKFGFWNILGSQKSRQNGQLAFESGGATSEFGGSHNVEPPLSDTA